MKYRLFSLFLFSVVVSCAAPGSDSRIPPPGTHLIRIDPGNDVWNVTAKKKPELLFDNNIDNGNKMDQEWGINNAFATPMVFFVSLGDSCYRQIHIDYFHGSGASNWTVTLYDSNRVQLGEFPLSGVYNAWALVKGTETVNKPVRFIRFQSQDPSSDLREFRLYGQAVAKCSPVAPISKPVAFPDPGIAFQGGSALTGKDTTYMKLSSGYPLYGSMRVPSNVFYWAHDPQADYDKQSFGLDKFGDVEQNTYRFHRRMGTPVMLYINGANPKALGKLEKDDFWSYYPSNNLKDIPPGSDSTSYEAWAKGNGRMWKVMAYLYGKNKQSKLSEDYRLVGNMLRIPGQDKIQTYEIGNEDDRTWLGMTGYHSPAVQLMKLKSAYDSIKSADPAALVYLGATLKIDTVTWKALYFLNYWKFPGQAFPADGFCFNQYINDRYEGQSHNGAGQAVSPEQFRVTERIKALKGFREHYFPGKGFRWTETGFDVAASSDYKVHAVKDIPDTLVQANMMVRTLERAAAVPNGIEAVYNYWHTSDGTGIFGSMFMVVEQFHPQQGYYTGSHRMPIWYWYATRMNVLHDYKGWSTMVKDGDSTGVTVTKYDHKTNAKKKVYYVVRGTYNGSVTSNYAVPVGPAKKATLVTMAVRKEEGERKELPVVNGKVIVPVVNEAPQYIIVEE